MSAKIVAIANQKGGVGKTTTSVNLAAALTAESRRVLLIDSDPQGNATMGSGVDKLTIMPTLNEVLQGGVEISSALIAKTTGGYALLPANADLTAAEAVLLRATQQETCLKNVLKSITPQYDFILIDCPPSLNMLTLNALVAAHSVLIPMQCEYYALEGVSALVRTIEQIRNTCNSALKIEGIVRTLYDARNRLAMEVTAQLVSHFGRLLYQTVIPRNVRLAEAPSHGLPVLLYDKTSKGAEAYGALAVEFLSAQKSSKKQLAEA